MEHQWEQEGQQHHHGIRPGAHQPASVSRSFQDFFSDDTSHQSHFPNQRSPERSSTVNNEDKIVRLLRTSKLTNGRGQQKHILLIPVVEESRTRDDSPSNSRSYRTSFHPEIAHERGNKVDSCDARTPDVLHGNNSRTHKGHNQMNVINEEYRTATEKLKREKSVFEREMEKVHETTNQNAVYPPQHLHNFIEDKVVSAIRDSLELLLHGQDKIGSRLDCLQREQVKGKQELEGDLLNIMDELKGDIAGKSFEQSMELEKVKVNQEHLHNELNIVNLRLEEMERLVSNLLQENKDENLPKLTEIEKPEYAEEITKSDSLQSVLSISSGSNVEEPYNQQKRSRKPSHALIFSQSVDDPKNVQKAETMEITRL